MKESTPLDRHLYRVTDRPGVIEHYDLHVLSVPHPGQESIQVPSQPSASGLPGARYTLVINHGVSRWPDPHGNDPATPYLYKRQSREIQYATVEQLKAGLREETERLRAEGFMLD